MRSFAAVISCVVVAAGALPGQGDATAVPPLPEFERGDATVFGRQLADYADRFDSGWRDSYASSVMTLYDAGGDSVQRAVVQLILEGADGDKSIVRFRSPAEVKGVAALTHEHPDATDDSWLYLPATKRVRRISGANKTASFQGTEFTYEDLSNRIVDKYDWRFVEERALDRDGEPAPVYVVEAVPRDPDSGYSKLVVYLHREHWRQERIDFYDRAGTLLKVLRFGEWEHLHGRFWRAKQLSMDNAQTKKRTVLEIRAQLLDLSRYKSRSGEPRRNLTDEDFTTRALSRGQ